MPKEGCIKNQFVQGASGFDFVEEIGGWIMNLYTKIMMEESEGECAKRSQEAITRYNKYLKTSKKPSWTTSEGQQYSVCSTHSESTII